MHCSSHERTAPPCTAPHPRMQRQPFTVPAGAAGAARPAACTARRGSSWHWHSTPCGVKEEASSGVEGLSGWLAGWLHARHTPSAKLGACSLSMQGTHKQDARERAKHPQLSLSLSPPAACMQPALSALTGCTPGTASGPPRSWRPPGGPGCAGPPAGWRTVEEQHD